MSKKFDMSFFKDECGNHFAQYKNLTLNSVFQPIFNQKNTIVGVEALLRMKSESGEHICPGYYFSDENPNQDDKSAIDLISRILHINNFVDSQHKQIKLFLNFLPNSFKTIEPSCPHEVRFLKELNKLKISSNQIVLELLEFHCDNIEQLKASVSKMAEHGFDIAIDDFGSEYSNSERVDLINPTIVKIDRMLLSQYMAGEQEKLLEAVAIAKAYGAQTVIEGIENQQQLDTMRALNINMYQGYYLGMPESMIPAA
ncbi:EAL domain-containing protein [Vibrio algivorus]|uniref:EAL domain-containing protein n=1 Tax=Vibrio algivorus TaxID=1667024 RepID=A0A557P8S6_9VIBR|nr:EAL domain-containing protein [Vibrio algivorus]TVO37060.1 EAL domain-containing protein [Vibrio algivorus]